MLKKLLTVIFSVLFILGIVWLFAPQQGLSLNPRETRKIGMQIWRNECGGTKEGLTSWNEREEFASLGIGHFIWYPENQKKVFKETFPELIVFLNAQGVELPEWLIKANGCPWNTREEFILAQEDPKMEQLRELLFEHIDLQILFIANRLQKALPAMVNRLDADKQEKITRQFYRLADSPAGLYVLIDYLNFKGEGTSPVESYQGQGWGLLQVLDQMESTGEPIEEFVASAKMVLDRRINHSPPDRKEERWRKGWFNRLDGYLNY